jgi:hypothetical protein
MLTQKRLKELFDYNLETGIFTRLIYKHYNAKAGDIAGSLDSRGYLCINVDGFQYKAHNLAWLYVTNEWPEYIDHENHLKHDNRFYNLKSVTMQENQRNQLRNKDNTSGVNGVYWAKDINRWRARITVNQKTINLGCFTDIKEAAKARKEAEIKYNFHVNHGKLLEQIT